MSGVKGEEGVGRGEGAFRRQRAPAVLMQAGGVAGKVGKVLRLQLLL